MFSLQIVTAYPAVQIQKEVSGTNRFNSVDLLTGSMLMRGQLVTQGLKQSKKSNVTVRSLATSHLLRMTHGGL